MRPIAGFLDVGGDAQHQPERVVVEVAADVVVAALGQRLILVERAAVFQLRGGQIEHALAGARGNHLDEAEQVLVGIAETQAASDAGFVEGGRTRHIERGHALVGVPDVDHAVGVQVRGLHLDASRASRPNTPERAEGRIRVVRLRYFAISGLHGLFVDRLRSRRIELAVRGIFLIAEQEDDLFGFAGLEA